jgi:hypothetical protein
MSHNDCVINSTADGSTTCVDINIVDVAVVSSFPLSSEINSKDEKKGSK